MTSKLSLIAAVAVASALGAGTPLQAQSLRAQAEAEARTQELLARLADPEAEDWEATADEIIAIWSRSGSPSADLLLDRGRAAMAAEDWVAAVEHFSALTEQAPDFAEGWNARATAYYMMDEYSLSIADIGRTLSLNPDHFGALSGLGLMLEEMGDEVNALAAYRAALAINPHLANIEAAAERLERLVGETRL